jgi:hypothetical protein
MSRTPIITLLVVVSDSALPSLEGSVSFLKRAYSFSSSVVVSIEIFFFLFAAPSSSLLLFD